VLNNIFLLHFFRANQLFFFLGTNIGFVEVENKSFQTLIVFNRADRLLNLFNHFSSFQSETKRFNHDKDREDDYCDSLQH